MKLSPLITALLLGMIEAHAQANMGTLTVQVGFPQGSYKKAYPATSSGLLFGIMHRAENHPGVSIGAELGILQVSGGNKYYTGNYNNQYNTYLVSSWNHIITLAGAMQLNLVPENESCNVSLWMSLGTNIFWTENSVSTEDRVVSYVKYYFQDSHASCALRAGLGFEMDFPMGRKKNIAIAIKGSYLFGSTARYYRRPVIHNTEISTFLSESNTSMVLTQAGIRFYLFNGN
jgi:hypothetical protein